MSSSCWHSSSHGGPGTQPAAGGRAWIWGEAKGASSQEQGEIVAQALGAARLSAPGRIYQQVQTGDV